MRLRFKPIADGEIQRAYRLRIGLFLIGTALVVILLGVISQLVQTLNKLDLVEAQRDRWQRPSEIIGELNLKDGDIVVDLGSGAGYFALKLAPIVGRGSVLAVDVRRLPLLILRMRALLLGQHNINVIRGDPDDPHLPTQNVNAVLIANTYHELTEPRSILASLSRSLVPGGRLVIVDRGPHSAPAESRQAEMRHHDLPSALVENELRENNFEIISRQDGFVTPPDGQAWWLIVARKR